jgi:hypothetical protein
VVPVRTGEGEGRETHPRVPAQSHSRTRPARPS